MRKEGSLILISPARRVDASLTFVSILESLNFEQENSMFFQAEFSKVMNWKITIEGNISGSRKEIIG